MLKLLADENFDNTIVRGLLRRRASLDIVRVQDVNLSGKDDLSILIWAASRLIDNEKVLLDDRTFTETQHNQSGSLNKNICEKLGDLLNQRLHLKNLNLSSVETI